MYQVHVFIGMFHVEHKGWITIIIKDRMDFRLYNMNYVLKMKM